MRLLSLPFFYTATILEKKHLIKPDKCKDSIMGRLQFLVINKQIIVYGFVIMRNHIHIIWQGEDGYEVSDVQHSFMKSTAQVMLKELKNHHPDALVMAKLKAADRNCPIRERNPLSVSL